MKMNEKQKIKHFSELLESRIIGWRFASYNKPKLIYRLLEAEAIKKDFDELFNI